MIKMTPRGDIELHVSAALTGGGGVRSVRPPTPMASTLGSSTPSTTSTPEPEPVAQVALPKPELPVHEGVPMASSPPVSPEAGPLCSPPITPTTSLEAREWSINAPAELPAAELAAWDELPAEIWAAVGSNLCVRDLGRLASVCRSFVEPVFANPLHRASGDGATVRRWSVIAEAARLRVGRTTQGIAEEGAHDEEEAIAWLRRLWHLGNPPCHFAQWGPDLSMSEDGAVVTRSGVGYYQSATCLPELLAPTEGSDGRHYLEVTWIHGLNLMVGVVGPSFDASAGAVAFNHGQGWCYNASSGRVIHDGTANDWPGMRSAKVGDKIGLLLDLNEGSLSVFLNGSRVGARLAHGGQGLFSHHGTSKRGALDALGRRGGGRAGGRGGGRGDRRGYEGYEGFSPGTGGARLGASWAPGPAGQQVDAEEGEGEVVAVDLLIASASQAAGTAAAAARDQIRQLGLKASVTKQRASAAVVGAREEVVEAVEEESWWSESKNELEMRLQQQARQVDPDTMPPPVEPVEPASPPPPVPPPPPSAAAERPAVTPRRTACEVIHRPMVPSGLGADGEPLRWAVVLHGYEGASARVERILPWERLKPTI